MRKHKNNSDFQVMALALALFVSLFMLSACNTRSGTVTETVAATAVTTTVVTPTTQKPTPLPQIADTPTPTPTYEVPAGLDCNKVSEIPAAECEAVIALYDSTNGPDWIDNQGWLASDTPCTWTGVDCGNEHITHLTLAYNELNGNLPTELGQLTQLVYLDLGNNELQGTLPAELGKLTELVFLELGRNQMTGPLPAELGNLVNLHYLGLGNNQFSGPIPPSLGSIETLETLYLLNNQLSGTIPSELGDMASLAQLNLSHNQLSGTIPATFGNLSALYDLDLSYNLLSGSVPEPLTNIEELKLWGNQLSGTISTDGQSQFTVDFMGVHFTADPSLAVSIWPEVRPATPLPDEPDGPAYWLAMPEHISFTFADPNLLPERRRMGFNLTAEAQILVFPLDRLAELNPSVQSQIETLQNLLSESGTIPDGELPVLPLTNSAQVFHAQAQYLNSDNIQGLRFITQYSQDPRPILLSPELFYTFQGISHDGAYYVAAFFPLSTAVLPSTIEVEDWEAFFANYDNYLLETTADLDQLGSADFTPDLSLLDAIIISIKVEPGIFLYREE